MIHAQRKFGSASATSGAKNVRRELDRPMRILVSAGEASSDHHGAAVVRELKNLVPDAAIFGMGGSALRAAGAETPVNSETSASVMGLTEVVKHLPEIFRAFGALVRLADERKPDVAILIDYPDFNLRLAKKLAARRIPVLYYISPQLWAWRSGRVKTMRRAVTKVAPIFPFEERFYHQHGVDAEYVGHPFLDELPLTLDRDAFLRSRGLDPARPVVALLPGSRTQEISRLLPVLEAAALRVRAGRPGTQFILPRASGISVEQLRASAPSGLRDITVLTGEAREVLTVADVAVVASGTATVEAALCGVPTIAVYKLSLLSYRIGRLLIRTIRHFAMPNLIAGEKVVDELLQDEVTDERIAGALERLLGDPGARAAARKKLEIVRRRLQSHGGGSAPKRAAQIALDLGSGKKRAR